MKHLKKFLAVALVCVMALTVLTGCGKSNKDYQNELTTKLTSANIGVTVDPEMNKSAEVVAKYIGKAVKAYLGGSGSMNYEQLVEDAAKEANLKENTKACVNIHGWNQVVNTGFNGSSDSTADASTFFVNELRSYNASNTEKITKVGVARYTLAGVDVVILLAE